VIILPDLHLSSYSGDVGYLVGSIAYFLAAVLDVYDSDKSRRLEPVARPSNLPFYRFDVKTETLILCRIFLFGAGFFLVGSVLYMPETGLPGYYGTFVFRGGSITYISGSCYGLFVLFYPVNHSDSKVNFYAVLTKLQYMVGSSLFIIGGELFMRLEFRLGAIVWIIGSVLFSTGSLTGLWLTWSALPPLEPPSPRDRLGLAPLGQMWMGSSFAQRF